MFPQSPLVVNEIIEVRTPISTLTEVPHKALQIWDDFKNNEAVKDTSNWWYVEKDDSVKQVMTAILCH